MRPQQKVLRFRKGDPSIFNSFLVFILSSSILLVSFSAPSVPHLPFRNSEGSVSHLNDLGSGQTLVVGLSHSIHRGEGQLTRMHKRRRSRRIVMALSIDTRLPASLVSERAELPPPPLEPLSLRTEPIIRPPAFI